MPDIFYIAIDLFWDCVGYSNSQKMDLLAAKLQAAPDTQGQCAAPKPEVAGRLFIRVREICAQYHVLFVSVNLRLTFDRSPGEKSRRYTIILLSLSTYGISKEF